jgi:tRNA 5-methylaminomethyl-2-thiouridine biosynthesis bifunctional protein
MQGQVTVVPAKLERDAGGTPFSSAFADVYHSSHGGLEQARHVFLAGNDLHERWRDRDCFTILETGFGLGLSFLAAWDAWRQDPRRPRRLHFLSVEAHPFARDDLAAALAPFAELEALARALANVWPPPLAGFHRLHFDAGNVILTLLFGEAHRVLPQLVGRADAFFLDGFSPANNPDMWSPEVVRELARLAAPGATLATWTVAGGVRAALADAGFEIEKRPGFASKRGATGRRGDGCGPARAARRVIGAGSQARSPPNAPRALEVDLVDTRGERALRRSAWCSIANLRDAINAQASRGAFLTRCSTTPALQRRLPSPLTAAACCSSPRTARAALLAAIALSQGYPAEFLEFVERARAGEIAARPVRGPGWWFPGGALVSPESLAVASLARAGRALRRVSGRRVERLEREGGAWRALDGDARVLAEAPVMVLANAVDAKRLLPEARLALSSVRGQVSYLPPAKERALGVVVSGSGYVAPLPGGGHCVGASYHHDDADGAVRVEDHRENLRRAESMLPGFTAGLEPAGLAGWTGFRATVPDRLPIFGPTGIAGLCAATGLGSRGLLWAPLGAELLACQLEGETLPLPRDLAGAISPKRFLS